MNRIVQKGEICGLFEDAVCGSGADSAVLLRQRYMSTDSLYWMRCGTSASEGPSVYGKGPIMYGDSKRIYRLTETQQTVCIMRSSRQGLFLRTTRL